MRREFFNTSAFDDEAGRKALEVNIRKTNIDPVELARKMDELKERQKDGRWEKVKKIMAREEEVGHPFDISLDNFVNLDNASLKKLKEEIEEVNNDIRMDLAELGKFFRTLNEEGVNENKIDFNRLKELSGTSSVKKFRAMSDQEKSDLYNSYSKAIHRNLEQIHFIENLIIMNNFSQFDEEGWDNDSDYLDN